MAAVIGIGLAASALMPLGAFASSPHFIGGTASIASPSGDLVVNFKEAGLGQDELVSITVEATANATWGCVNHGGNHPSASNKVAISGPVSDSGLFSTGKNGEITQTLTASPPAPPADYCPGSMILKLVSVTYSAPAPPPVTSGITIFDNTNGIHYTTEPPTVSLVLYPY